MGSRSWLGAFACFATWLFVHRFSSGWAAPSFFALCLGCLYLWFLVLRVPKLGEELAEAWPEESELLTPDPTTATTATRARATPVEAPAEQPAEQAAEGTEPSHCAAMPMSDAEVSAAKGSGEELEKLEADAQNPEEIQNFDEQVTDEGQETEGPAEATPDASEQHAEPDADVDDMVDAAKAQELRLEGNEHFKAGRLHDAREAYSEALHLSPPAGDPSSEASKDRAVLHCNRAACLQRLERWDDVVKDCSQAIKLDPSYVKAFARRSVAYEELQKWHDAFEDLKKSVELDPSLRAKESRRITILEKRAQEQFEKDKDEMLSKLKDLGNTVLGKFGMSTDNFKLEQDPDTGSYSIKFQN